MNKQVQKKEDGRYIIFYTFPKKKARKSDSVPEVAKRRGSR